MRPPPPAGWEERAERAVARGRRNDRFLPRVLLDSPISRAGARYATAVGWLWGFVLSTGTVERREGLWVFRGLPAWAFGRGGTCVGSCFLTGSRRPDARVIRHEAVHAAQWRRYGMLMPVLYLLAGRDALTNRFEIEAGLADGNYVPRR